MRMIPDIVFLSISSLRLNLFRFYRIITDIMKAITELSPDIFYKVNEDLLSHCC